MQAKFKKEAGETILKKGGLVLHEGEVGVMNALKGKYVVTQCNGILTSSRFVLCKKTHYFPWGPLIWIFIYLFSNRKIVVEMPLGSVASVDPEGGKSRNFILRTGEGGEFRVSSGNVFDNSAEWIRAIKEAVGGNGAAGK